MVETRQDLNDPKTQKKALPYPVRKGGAFALNLQLKKDNLVSSSLQVFFSKPTTEDRPKSQS